MKPLVAAAVLLLGLGLVAGAAGADGTWRTVTNTGSGFSIGVPARWQVVPRSTPELNAAIVRLRAAKQAALANQLAQIAAVRRATRTTFGFQAFAWPPPKGAVVPDVTVKVDRLSARTTEAVLPSLARQIAKALAGTAGATASAPVATRLPAGRAMRVTGTTRISKTLGSRYALYLLIHGRRLYSLTFRGPATASETRTLESFRFAGP